MSLIDVIARKQCMKTYPNSLVRTWLFLSQATDPKLQAAKDDARKQLNRIFGSVELAIIYLEQASDENIEVVLV